jgi:predicted DCC family thiol-disulfide oxidoreductase YuxK
MNTTIETLPLDSGFLKKKATWIFNALSLWLAVHLLWILPDASELLGSRSLALSGNAVLPEFASQRFYGLQLSSIFQNYWMPFCAVYLAMTLLILLSKKTKLLWVLIVPMTLMLNARIPEILDGGNNLNQIVIVYMLFAIPFLFLSSKTTYWMIKLALLMAQFQVCFMYVTAGWAKLMGSEWQSGLALFYIFQNSDFSFPWIQDLMLKNYWLSIFGSYFAIVFQALFPILIWFKKARPFLILAGLMLHLGIGVGMGLPNFSAMMCLSYLFFLDESDIQAIENLVNSKRRVTIAIDENCNLCKVFAKLVSSVDFQKKLVIDSAQTPLNQVILSADTGSRLFAMVSCVESSGKQDPVLQSGFKSILLLSKELLLLFPFYPILKVLDLSGWGDALYKIIAKNRKQLGCGETCQL